MKLNKLALISTTLSLIFLGCAPSSENNNSKQEKKEKKDDGGGNPLMGMMGGGGGGGNPMMGMMGGMGGGMGGMGGGMGGGQQGGGGGQQGGGGGGQQKIITYYKLYTSIVGLDYITDRGKFITKNDGVILINKRDKRLTLKVGDLFIANVSNIKDNKLLISDFISLKRGTINKDLIKLLIFFYSLDEDKNLLNGITISSYTKDFINNYIQEYNLSKNLLDNSLDQIKNMLLVMDKEPISEKEAISYYKNLLKVLGY